MQRRFRPLATLLVCFAGVLVGGQPMTRASDPASTADGTLHETQTPAADDPRPIIRLRVINEFKREDQVLPLVVEGRLLTDLQDMETFRMVPAERPGDYLLTCTLRNLSYASGERYLSTRDAESGSTPSSRSEITVTLDMDVKLEDPSGKEVYAGKISSQANREIEISLERSLNLAQQELIDRAAQKIEKQLRKRLKKR